MAKFRMQCYVDYEDWEYIVKIANALDVSAASIVRDMLKQFVVPMRKALGDNPEQADVFQFMRVLMGEAANVLHEASMFPELYRNKLVKAAEHPEGLALTDEKRDS